MPALKLIQKPIDGIKNAVDIAFDKDIDCLSYCDQTMGVKSCSELANAVLSKLKEYPSYFPLCRTYEVVMGEAVIGFAFITMSPNQLVSFGISKPYRNADILSSFFRLLADELEHRFTSLMFDNNTRAIKWLERCGMENKGYVYAQSTIMLNYDKCQ